MPGLSAGAIPIPLDTDPVGDGALALRNLAAAVGDPWTAYTPTWTAPTTSPVIGNGSITGAYRLIGKTVHFRIIITMGSTTTYGSGGAYSFGLPVTAKDANGLMVSGWTNGLNLTLVARGATTTTLFAYRTDTVAALGSGTGFASGHRIQLAGTYEAA